MTFLTLGIIMYYLMQYENLVHFYLVSKINYFSQGPFSEIFGNVFILGPTISNQKNFLYFIYIITEFNFASNLRQGLLNRWTSQLDLGCTTGGLTFNLNNGTKSHLIIVKLLENTFLGMTKVRDWPILTLAMLSVKTEQIQNFALF